MGCQQDHKGGRGAEQRTRCHAAARCQWYHMSTPALLFIITPGLIIIAHETGNLMSQAGVSHECWQRPCVAPLSKRWRVQAGPCYAVNVGALANGSTRGMAALIRCFTSRRLKLLTNKSRATKHTPPPPVPCTARHARPNLSANSTTMAMDCA
jgi:hypothetical protein